MQGWEVDPSQFIPDAEIEARRRLLEFTAADTKRLQQISPVLKPHVKKTVVEAFTTHIMGFSEAASLLQSVIRQVDSAFRYGGDEFAVLLLETELRGALVVA